MKEVVIVSACRTALGSFGGSLKNISAVDLGVTVAKEAINRAGIKAEQVEDVIFGNVLQAGSGQNVARQIGLKAGLAESSTAMTVNILCGSGLKSVALGATQIMTGESEIVLCGGTESMSMAPYVAKDARWGAKMGNIQMIDTVLSDGLVDAFNDYHMGITAENIVEQWGLTREQLDEFAAKSQNKAEAASESGRFADEIVPVIIPQRKGDPVVFAKDEFIKAGSTAEKLAKLRPAFKKDGTVTAGNASGVNDGAAALILMSADKAKELGITPIAKIVSYATAGVDPKIMGIGPVPATQKALAKAGLDIKDIDLVEANEAFAAQSLAVVKDLGLDLEKTNVNGGAIALGHPIGASGARILVTLIHEMEKRGAKKGLATLCIGGGQGQALIIEK